MIFNIEPLECGVCIMATDDVYHESLKVMDYFFPKHPSVDSTTLAI